MNNNQPLYRPYLCPSQRKGKKKRKENKTKTKKQNEKIHFNCDADVAGIMLT